MVLLTSSKTVDTDCDINFDNNFNFNADYGKILLLQTTEVFSIIIWIHDSVILVLAR